MVNKRPPIEVSELSENLQASTGRGLGAFFSTPPQPQPAPTTPKQATETPAPRYYGTGVPRDRGTTAPTTKREIKRRHPFDIYCDQLRVLKDFSIEEKRAGGIGSESAMVRQAIDAYIEKRRRK